MSASLLAMAPSIPCRAVLHCRVATVSRKESSVIYEIRTYQIGPGNLAEVEKRFVESVDERVSVGHGAKHTVPRGATLPRRHRLAKGVQRDLRDSHLPDRSGQPGRSREAVRRVR